ncbi:MAG: Fimbrial assembly protein [Candidatus Acidoferrum typicum]|nr:Fimbrial assembly protein [Candidatus Acidoferrum typicum]
MIRINLLGRSRPKAVRQAVPLEATLQLVFLLVALVFSFGLLYIHYWQMEKEDKQVLAHIQKQRGEKARLEQLKQQVDNFEKQKAVLQQKISVIEELQRNRTGGQQLLDAIANTVGRTDTVWLTSVSRKADVLSIVGSAGSIDAVANYITQLKRSGYFQQVEIKESHQDTTNKAVQLFIFTLTAQFAPPSPTAASTTTATASPNPNPTAPGSPAAPAKRPGGNL